MARTGDSGLRLATAAFLFAAAVIACGGESKTNDGGGDDGDDDERGGTAGTGGGSGGSTAARGGSGVTGGFPSGGSGANPSTRGGTGNVDPIEPPGPSFCGGLPCDPPLACCLSTGECFDPANDGVRGCALPPPDDDPQGRKPCNSSAQCEPNEYCMTEGALCVGTGHCQPIDNCGSCESGDPSIDFCRVCGCDGNTYPNVQTMCRAGVNAVGPSGVGCGETGMEGGAGSSSIGPRPYTSCGHDAQCPTGSFCCTLNARCYAESDRDICIPPPPGARIACKTTENCGDLEYCRGDGCNGPGGCVSMGSGPGDCGVTLEPVCGCDGVSYTSAACADQQGVRVEHDGECN
ncbi:MAG TPA: Kazal-type serine protease inhibitor domain-containing protein [Polyangiaceae bacterium]